MEQPREQLMGDHILASPRWIFWIRVFQFAVSVIILGLAAALIHDAYLDEEGLALAISVITWLVVAYAVLSEKLAPLQPINHVLAVIILDGVMVILWLATFAAVAARRAKFKYHVTVDACFNTGNLINSKICFKKREELAKRGAVILFKRGQDMLSAVAGLGALVWLLFIASFAWTLWAFFNARKQGRFQFGSTQANTQVFQMEPKVEQQPVPNYAPHTEFQQQQTAQGQYPAPYAYPPHDHQAYPVQQQQQLYPPVNSVSPPPAAISPAPPQQY